MTRISALVNPLSHAMVPCQSPKGLVLILSLVATHAVMMVGALGASNFDWSVEITPEDSGIAGHVDVEFMHSTMPSAPSSSPITYTAAVIEHGAKESHWPWPLSTSQAEALMKSNLDLYEEHLHTAVSQGAQIVVFPEDGLYGPDILSRDLARPYCEEFPKVLNGAPFVNPATNSSAFPTSPSLVRASQLAIKYNTVIVLNLCNAVKCDTASDPNCPSDGQYQYNTNVALAETGQLLAVYHKSHLYFEDQFDQPPTPDPVYFDTSFGVRFGTMICFDMVFPNPQTDLRNEGITDIAFTSLWVNDPPLFTATMFQQAFSRRYGLNFLASGSSNRQLAAYLNSGSGIYSSGDVKGQFYNSGLLNKEQVVVSHVTTPPPPSDIVTEDITNASTSAIVGEGEIVPNGKTQRVSVIAIKEAHTSYTSQLQVGTLTCTASVTASSNGSGKFPVYFGLLGVQGPFESLDYAELCFVVKCTTALCDSVLSPVPSFRSSTTFSQLQIKGTFSSDVTTFPLAATDHSMLLAKSTFNVTSHSVTLSEESVILSAGLSGRRMTPQ